MKISEAEVLKTLRGARRRVARGWTKGTYHRTMWSASGKSRRELYCSVGALHAADGPGEETAVERLGRAVLKLFRKRVVGTGVWDVIGFNDNEDTSKADVLAAFDAAIADAEAREAAAAQKAAAS